MRIADPRDILIAPVVSEELRTAGREQVHLPGAPGCQQDQIKIAVEQVFGVKVLSVNTLNRPGKASAQPRWLRPPAGHQARHRFAGLG